MNTPTPSQAGVVLPLTTGRRRLAFALVLAVAVGASLVFSVLPPVLPALAKHFGGGEAGELSAQFALTMPSLGWLIGGAVSGWVLVRMGTRRTITLSILVLGMMGALGGVLPDVATFAAARFVVGLAAAFMITAAVTLLANIYDDAARPKMIGYMKAMSSGAAIPIALTTGVLAQTVDWRAPFALYLVFGIVGALFALAAAPPAQAPRAAAERDRSAERAGLKSLWPVLVMILFLHIVPMMGVAQLPFILAEHDLRAPQAVSYILSASALMMSVGAIVSGHLQARFGPWPVLVLGAFLAAAGYAVMGLAPNWQITAAGNILGIFGCGVYFPQYLTLPLARVSADARPMAIGLSQAATYVGAFINPFVIAPLRVQFGISGAYLAVAIILATCVLAGVAVAGLRQAARARATVAAN